MTPNHPTNGDGPHDPRLCDGSEAPDLGDFVIVLLSGTLGGLRDRLLADGFATAAELVADLTELTDEYVAQRAR